MLLRLSRHTRARACARALSSPAPVTPDFTTSVNVADIRLSKPARRAKDDTAARRNAASWDGLNDLATRTRGSLVESTLKEMETDGDFQLTAARLKKVGARKMSLDERKKRRRALHDLGVPDFWEFVEERSPIALERRATQTMQINIGLYCNQACGHCHVESSPKRHETLSAADAERCIELIAATPSLTTLDITGGAPELAEQFRPVVQSARALRPDLEIIDRCNLTVLTEPGQEDLVNFLAEQRVHVVASLPCYSAKNVNTQRGNGVFDRSVAGLLMLNERGYGAADSGLVLDLVYNPLGAFLPPPQDKLEAKYKEELESVFGIVFNSLFTITNMPIKRFADFLHRRGELKEYMELLVRNFNPGTIDGLMCRNTVSIAHDGSLYDCDFNQQLLMGAGTFAPPGGVGRYAPDGGALTVHDVASLDELLKTEIVVDSHCFGCTAGMGSS